MCMYCVCVRVCAFHRVILIISYHKTSITTPPNINHSVKLTCFLISWQLCRPAWLRYTFHYTLDKVQIQNTHICTQKKNNIIPYPLWPALPSWVLIRVWVHVYVCVLAVWTGVFSRAFIRFMEVFLILTGEVSAGVLAQWVRCLRGLSQWEGTQLPPHTQKCMYAHICYCQALQLFCYRIRETGVKKKPNIFSLNFLPPSLYSLNLHILFTCNTTYLHSRCTKHYPY